MLVEESTLATHFDTALMHFHAGDRAQARTVCHDILSTFPDHLDANHFLGFLLLLDGHPVEAESRIRTALANHSSPQAELDLALTLEAQKRLADAELALRRATGMDPNFALAHFNLGRILHQQGDDVGAELAFLRSLELHPDSANSHCQLGLTLSTAGRSTEALAAFRRALEIHPEWAEVHSILGSELSALNQPVEAEHAFRRALEIKPDLVQAHLSLARLLQTSSRQPDEAETHSRRAIELNPNDPVGHAMLGSVLAAKNSGDMTDALNRLRHAIELDPDCLDAYGSLAYFLPFVSDDGYAVLDECRRLAEHFEAPHLSTPVRYLNDKTRSRRLRIGYVSPNFRRHCQCFFMTPLLKNHDHDAVEVYCYASGSVLDESSRRLATLADVWRDVRELDDEQLARQIMDDHIDILVDLTMYMAEARPTLFARRPAPVQVAWLAYPGTTGGRAISYRLTDPWLDPPDIPGADDRYSERSIRLPDTFWCYDPLASGPDVNALPAKRTGYITFGCLNNPCKLTDRAFTLWAKVMRKVPRSRLKLFVAKGEARQIVRAKFAALGISRGRLSFVDYQPHEHYLRTYQGIDIALDTFPYNGHTTTLDGLWMGVPVVTTIGRMPTSRGGYSLLSNLGLQELAADSDEAFIECAVDLAMNLPRLSALRAGLRTRMEQSALMDGPRFARSMEAAFRHMWAEWCDENA
jgi:predicted O-linked N-acetylglucosamine transferase (SPINDLY family)